jgi:hypothetical protein
MTRVSHPVYSLDSFRTSEIIDVSFRFLSLPFLQTVIPFFIHSSDQPAHNESSFLAMILGIVGEILIVLCILEIVIFLFIHHRCVQIESSKSGNLAVPRNEFEFVMSPQLTSKFFDTFNGILSYEFDQTGEVCQSGIWILDSQISDMTICDPSIVDALLQRRIICQRRSSR